MGSRAPGQTCFKALEALERYGPMGAAQLCDLLMASSTNNMNQFMMRSAERGFVTVKPGRRNIADFKVYTICPDWRETYKALYNKPKPKRKSRARVHTKWYGVSSVFQMGAM